MHRFRPRSGLFYGWWLVAIGAVIIGVYSGDSMPLIGKTLLEDSERDYVQVTVALVAAGGLAWLLMPAVGWGIDRWGPRRLALYGLALLGLAALASAVAHVPAVFYASYTLFRLSTGLGGTLAVMAMLNNWFRRRRAMAMALVLILPGLVVVLSTPFAIAVGVLQALHGPAASVIVGLAALAAIWPLSCWLVNRPEDRGESPDGPQAIQGTGNTPPATDSTEAESEWRWQEAVKGRDFWLMVAGDTGTTLGVQTAWIALILARGDGWVMALAGLVQAGARRRRDAHGWAIGDRVAIRNAVFGFSSARALGVVLSLAWAVVSDGDAVVFASAILIGIGSGGLAPLGFAMRGAYFGRRNFGAINGLSLFVYTVAVSAGHFGAAALMTLEGTKIPALVTPAIFAVVGAGLFLLLGNPRPSPSQRAATTAVAD